MAQATVTNRLLDLSGNAIAHVPVVAELYPDQQAFDPGGHEIESVAQTTTDASGNWSLSLERTDTMIPSGMVYRIREPNRDGKPRVSYITVPASGGTLEALLTAPPVMIAPVELAILESEVAGLEQIAPFNVKAYGAAGNGTTDDTAAINAAITAAGTGGIVFLPAGTYKISTGLLPLANQHLRGASWQAVTIKAANASNLDYVVGVNGNGVRISELTLDCNGSNQTSGVGDGIYASTKTGVTVDHNKIINCTRGNGAIHFESCTDIEVSHNWVDGHNARSPLTNAGALYLNQTTNGVCAYNLLTNSNQECIQAGWGNNWLIIGNVMDGTGTGYTAIDIGSCQHTVVTGNVAKNVGGGVFFASDAQESYALLITGNEFYGNGAGGAQGLYLQANAAHQMHDIVIEGNVFDNFGARGAYITSDSTGTSIHGLLIRGNLIRACQFHGISILDAAAGIAPYDIQIAGNRIIDCGQAGGTRYGIQIIGASQLRIVDNRISGANHTAGISLADGTFASNPCDVLVEGNDLRGNVAALIGYGPNILPEYDFEDGTMGWAVQGGGAISQSTLHPASGTHSLLVQPAAADQGASFQIPNALASTAHAYSVWLYDAAGGTYKIGLSDHIDQSMDSGNIVVPAGVLTRASFSASTDTHATGRWWNVRRQSAAGNFYIDLAKLEVGSASTPTKAIVRRNQGFATENSGMSSIPSGSTSVVVTHGLDIAPRPSEIGITGIAVITNAPGALWITNAGGTTFTVNCAADPGASGLQFSWRVY